MTDQLSSEAAAAELATLKADPKFVEAYTAGNGPEVTKFRELSERAREAHNATSIDKAIRGEREDGMFQSAEHVMRMGTADFMKSAGLDENEIRHVLADKAVTKAERDAAEREKNMLMSDQDFTKKYLAGDGPAKQKMLRLSAILSSPIQEEKAA